ncbi:redoxin family protein [Streptomyces bathyalis]|uniref:Redoxin family protein n=1 Tax=Streptomyces bathyalis TaxID=2710756 RepID=A0A7T1WSE8_9ACTN|nr:redoxin family protein [Streptomyces bathyalis]QPP05665.1 redoxin family protein [Streptomyces bathyalis]
MRAGRTRVALTALLVASSLSLAGCGMDDGGSASSKPADKAAADDQKADDEKKAPDKDAPEGIAPGEKDPNGKATPAKLQFTSQTLDGKAFKGASLADKPSVLWFWAPWCGTCQGQAAQTAKLADKYKGKINFIGVAGLDKTEPIKGFVKTQKVGNFPHLNDQKGAVWKKFGITQQSSFVMLDKNGKTVEQGAATTPDQLSEQVAGLAG